MSQHGVQLNKNSLHHHSFRQSSSIQPKAHQLFNIRSSSDGVERHFEENNESICNDQHYSQPKISSSDLSFDTSSIASAYYPTRQDETNNSNNSISIRSKDLLFTQESNDETFSSDSNESAVNINTTTSSNYNGNDLNVNVNNGNGNGNDEKQNRKKVDRKKSDDKKRHVGLFRGIRAIKKKI